MVTIEPLFGAGILPALQKFVMVTRLHPILVNFTAALVPVSVASDFLGWLVEADSLRQTAWWTLFYTTVVTPFTAITGWLFVSQRQFGVTGKTILKN
jgi:uncharacterized membrane protein